MMISTPSFVDAATTISIDDRGGYYKQGPYYDPDRDAIRYEFNTKDLKKSKIEYFHDAGFTQAGTVKENTVSHPDSWYQWTTFNCTGYYRQTFYDAAGNVLVVLQMEVEPGDLVTPACDSGSGKDDDIGKEDSTCDSCAVFNCPGWNDYMGKLDEIKAAIPPPPNWNEVAGIFRDTIAPRIKQDLIDIIGVAPEPSMPSIPATPDAPTAPPQLPPLNDQGFTAPTGSEAPGLGDSGFTSSDIKSEAPEIPLREDPTGGFSIIDPIGSMPSQEEFIKNAPIEGDVPFPAAPKDPENKAPTPGDTTDAPPMPGDTNDTAPIPGNNTDTAPMPGENPNTAPIPADTRDPVPIPSKTNES